MRGFSIEDKYIDYRTGELVQKHTRRRLNQENDYSKVYSDHLDMVFGLSKVQRNMLDLLGVHMSYAEDGQIVCMNPIIKEEIEQRCGIKRNSINKALTNLVALGILRRKALNTYQINPYVMGKGAWEDVMALREKYDTEVLDNARE